MEDYSDILEQSRRCLVSMWDSATRISELIEKGNFDSLARALDAREAAIQNLQSLGKKIDSLNRHMCWAESDKREINATVKEVHRLIGLLISQGEKDIAVLHKDMNGVTQKLAEISKGKNAVTGYQNAPRKYRCAAFTG